MKNRIIWAFLTLIPIGLSIPISYSFIHEYKVFSKGKIVNVCITKNESSRNTGTMYFDYKGKNYSSFFKRSTYDFNIGDTIQLRYLDGYEHYFLLPDYNPCTWAIIDYLIFGIMAIAFIYYFIKNKDIPSPYSK